MPDFVIMEYEGIEQRVQVVQIWIDTKHPEAINDPQLRAYMERRGREGLLSLIRMDARRAITVFPPSMSPDGEWHAKGAEQSSLPQWATWPEHARPDV
jgi:hypothetical protein